MSQVATFQVWCATNLGTTKVFQSKSVIGGDLDNPGQQDVKIIKLEDGMVIIELLLAKTETVGSTSLITPPSECFGWIQVEGRQYFADRIATYNSNGGQVYVAFHVTLQVLA